MAQSLGSYLDFLKVLLSLGPKLQTLWPKIQAVITAVTDLVAHLKPEGAPADGLQLVSATAEEAEAEAQIGARIVDGNPQALFDGALLRQAWAYIKAHPETLAWLLSFLKG